MSDEHPFSRLRAVERTLLEADEVPLLGGLPPFPVEQVAHKLETLFGVDALQLKVEPPHWREGADAANSLGAEPLFIPLICPTLEGRLGLAIEVNDIRALLTGWLGGEDQAAALWDGPLREGFARFMVVETIGALGHAGWPRELLPHLAAGEMILTEPTLCMDVLLQIADREARLRLLLSTSFCNAVRRHFAPRKPTKLSEELARQLHVELGVELGGVELEAAEFAALTVGDFVVLDQCGIDPEKGQGEVVLHVADQPFCAGSLSDGQVQLRELE